MARNFKDIVTVAITLQDAADYLLSIDFPPDPPEQESPVPYVGTNDEQIRAYRVPLYALSRERELLDAFEQRHLSGVIAEIYNELSAPLMLLHGYSQSDDWADDERMFKLGTFSRQLQKTLEHLSKYCTLMADFQLVFLRRPVEATD